MNSIAEAKLRNFLRDHLHYDPYECGTIIYNIRSLARMAGHDIDPGSPTPGWALARRPGSLPVSSSCPWWAAADAKRPCTPSARRSTAGCETRRRKV